MDALCKGVLTVMSDIRPIVKHLVVVNKNNKEISEKKSVEISSLRSEMGVLVECKLQSDFKLEECKDDNNELHMRNAQLEAETLVLKSITEEQKQKLDELGGVSTEELMTSLREENDELRSTKGTDTKYMLGLVNHMACELKHNMDILRTGVVSFAHERDSPDNEGDYEGIAEITKESLDHARILIDVRSHAVVDLLDKLKNVIVDRTSRSKSIAGGIQIQNEEALDGIGGVTDQDPNGMLHDLIEARLQNATLTEQLEEEKRRYRILQLRQHLDDH